MQNRPERVRGLDISTHMITDEYREEDDEGIMGLRFSSTSKQAVEKVCSLAFKVRCRISHIRTECESKAGRELKFQKAV